MDNRYKSYSVAAVQTVYGLAQKNDFWVKSEEGRDVLVPHKYQEAFRFKINALSSSSCTTEASRASALVQMHHQDLAQRLAEDDWSRLFPTMVAKDDRVIVLLPGSSHDNPHGTLLMVFKEIQSSSPAVANTKFTVLRQCLQIHQAAWVIAELSYVTSPNTYRRLPSGCLIQRITDDVSKVTWVEHMEFHDQPLPNTTPFASESERMVALLQRLCERASHMTAACHIQDPQGKEVPGILEKLALMDFGETMVRGLFENVTPNEDANSTLWRSFTGSEDLKVYASLYKSSANFEVAAGVVTFSVRHSPELVLQTVGDERTHHEWDVLGGLTKLCPFRKYSTGGDTRNNISAFMIDGSSSEMLIKEVNVNRSGALVFWSTVSMKDFDVMSHGQGYPEDPVLISGFSITSNGHTAATNTGGSVITLVLQKLVESNQPLQEKRQQSLGSITFAINQTVGRVKEALEKHQPPSPGGDWPTEKQQVGAGDIASEIMQDELGVLKLN